jgi:hypothetical protein
MLSGMTDAKSARNRRYTPAETRLLAEWIAERRPNVEVRTHVFVGPIGADYGKMEYDPTTYAMLGVRRRWADAIVLYPDRTEIVEAKIVPDVTVIAQLSLYMQIFPATDEYRDRRALPVTGRIVSAVSDPALVRLIQQAGLTAEVYHPAWTDDYLATMNARHAQVRRIPA